MKDDTNKKTGILRRGILKAFSSQEGYDDENDDAYDRENGYDDDTGSGYRSRLSEYEDISSHDTSTSFSSSSFKTPSSSTSSSSSSSSYKYSSPSYKSGGTSETSQPASGNLYKMTDKPKFRLSILRLEKLEDAVKVADDILSENTITLIDLRYVQKDVLRRIIDFIDGVRYTNKAQMETVADYTYVVVPRDVEMTGDLLSQIDTGNMYI